MKIISTCAAGCILRHTDSLYIRKIRAAAQVEKFVKGGFNSLW